MKLFSKSHPRHHSFCAAGVSKPSPKKANNQSGFLSYQVEAIVFKDSGIPFESFVYLVGQPS